MSKTVIDLDDNLLGRAAALLDTSTAEETVTCALVEIVRRGRHDVIDWLATDPLPDLRDVDVTEQAWR